MLHGEILRVMEDCDGLAVEGRVGIGVAVGAHSAFW